MITGLEHLSYGDKLGQLRLLSLDKKSLQGNLTATSQYLEGTYKKGEEGFLAWACSDRTRL